MIVPASRLVYVSCGQTARRLEVWDVGNPKGFNNIQDDQACLHCKTLHGTLQVYLSSPGITWEQCPGYGAGKHLAEALNCLTC